MKLNIPERIILLNILPLEGDVITLRLLMELKKNLGFTEEEIAKWSLTTKIPQDKTPYVVWNDDFTKETKDIIIGATMKSIITLQLRKLDESKKLRMEMISLYERFVDGKQ